MLRHGRYSKVQLALERLSHRCSVDSPVSFGERRHQRDTESFCAIAMQAMAQSIGEQFDKWSYVQQVDLAVSVDVGFQLESTVA